MDKFKSQFKIESIRLKGWDYTNPWWYYVTINTKNHLSFFGEIDNNIMMLNESGKIADEFWKEIPNHFKNAALDYYVVMPNHIHGIVIIESRDVACNVSTKPNHDSAYGEISPRKGSLSAIVRSYKSAVSHQMHKIGRLNFLWQPGYYERIIRNEKELFNIRTYIEQNPLRWNFGNDDDEFIFEN